jgi:hypothetical protein
MSTIQTNAIVDASGGNTATVNGISPLANSARFARNLIINGDMNVAQRATSQVLTSGLFTCDRFQLHSSGLDQWAGTMAQFVEAQNLQHLKFGSSSAQSLTVSFWVKSSLTGVFGQSLYTQDNSGMANATYTINTANTWEYKTITYAGDTSRGINNDTGEGLRVIWALAAGTNLNSDPTNNAWESYTDAKFNGGHVQNALLSTDNATIQFTGIQVETGTVATDFEHKTYASELTACQRYFQLLTAAAGFASSTSAVEFGIGFYPEMRGAPSAAATAALIVERHNITAYTQSSAAVTIVHSTSRGAKFTISNFSGLTAGNGYTYSGYQSGSGHIILSAEI